MRKFLGGIVLGHKGPRWWDIPDANPGKSLPHRNLCMTPLSVVLDTEWLGSQWDVSRFGCAHGAFGKTLLLFGGDSPGQSAQCCMLKESRKFSDSPEMGAFRKTLWPGYPGNRQDIPHP